MPDVCAVALPLPTERPYSYAIPKALADRVVVGTRVVVPVRHRSMVGIVTSMDAPAADAELKPVLLAPDAEPLLSSSLIELAEWMSRYYLTPLGIVLKLMLPGALWGASKVIVRLAGSARVGGASAEVLSLIERTGGVVAATTIRKRIGRPVWDVLQRLERAGAVTLETVPPDIGPAAGAQELITVSAQPDSLLAIDRQFGRAAKQKQAFQVLLELGGEAATARLREDYGVSRAVMRALVDRGLARFEHREKLRDPFAGAVGEPQPEPNSEQRDAIDSLARLERGNSACLFGVTSSGKTLVYLEALRRRIGEDRGAIVLIPEISLTPQTVARVRGVFGDTVTVIHSALSDSERADAWRAVAQGERRVVVGARSAVFAPVRRLAAIVLDEEHDASYKNGEAPRYHVRDVAAMRGRVEGSITVLSSATPSIETWDARDRITVTRLTRRTGSSPMPRVDLVDLRKTRMVEGSGAVPWSVELDTAIERRLSTGEQVILLLNRRGFANYVQCRNCGDVNGCPHCSIALTVHKSPERLFCHYCGHTESVPTECRQCGSPKAVARGVGTQQLERWVTKRYGGGGGGARVARMDADTTGSKWAHERILGEFSAGRIDVLLGTQMIAKGHDFPGVTLVGVIDADTALHLPDFRAAERTFQLTAQVAGRAGRGSIAGQVIVQTRSPEHYALRAAAHHDYEEFAARELELRRDPPYPPHAALVNVILSGTDSSQVAERAVELGEWLRELTRTKTGGAVHVVGPTPAPLARVQQRWRWHLLLRSGDRAALGRVARYASANSPGGGRGRGPRQVRVVFDRDPMSLL